LRIETRWENIGVAPIYREFVFAVRLIPFDAPLGKYQLEVAIVSPVSFEPCVQLAIEGKTNDGWYGIGAIEIKENNMRDR